MPQDPLLSEIAERCRTFSAGTGVSLNKIAKLIGVETGNFSAFVNGRIGLSARSTVKLLQLLNLTKRQVEEKLAIKPVTIAHFQQGGKQVAEQVRFAAPPVKQFDSWVPGLSGQDPNGSTDITSTNEYPARSVPDAAELEFLAGLAGLHRQIIDRIDNWQAQQKAQPNPSGSTGPGREISRPKMPGPRGDLI
jgi:plasmid maintenance system antidote protein VapI